MTHQLSYTLAFVDGGSGVGAGDTLINYRYQALEEGPGRPAFSPRASLVLPTGSVSEGRGSGSYGLQVNLPFSKRRGAIYWHGNAGFTWLPRAEAAGSSAHANLWSPFLAGSTIYALRPMFHLMLEQVLLVDAVVRRRRPVADHVVHALARGARRLEPRQTRQLDRRRRGADHLGKRRTPTPACSSTCRTSCRSSRSRRRQLRCTTRTTTASPRPGR